MRGIIMSSPYLTSHTLGSKSELPIFDDPDVSRYPVICAPSYSNTLIPQSPVAAAFPKYPPSSIREVYSSVSVKFLHSPQSISTRTPCSVEGSLVVRHGSQKGYEALTPGGWRGSVWLHLLSVWACNCGRKYDWVCYVRISTCGARPIGRRSHPDRGGQSYSTGL